MDDVSVRGTGHTPDKKFDNYFKGHIKWISLADSKFLDNGYIGQTAKCISEEGIKHSSAVIHPKNSVLLSRDAGVGKSAVMETKMAVSQHFIFWTPIENKLSTWFLYYSEGAHSEIASDVLKYLALSDETVNNCIIFVGGHSNCNLIRLAHLQGSSSN